MSSRAENAQYEAPEFRLLGNIADVTRAGTSGTVFDGDFNQGDPPPPGFLSIG